jgi:hypothetical protein
MIERPLPKGIGAFSKPETFAGSGKNLYEDEIKKKIKEIKKSKNKEREEKLDKAANMTDEEIILENIARRKKYEAKLALQEEVEEAKLTENEDSP